MPTDSPSLDETVDAVGDALGSGPASEPGVDTELQMARLHHSLFDAEGGHGPVKLGRFVIVERVGSGGMGTVFAAYDPELDRKVAIKMLKRGFGEADRTEHERLLREAKAMARVHHPNVVTIHDVGMWRGQTYIAMEFVDGRTLRGWLVEQPRTVAEVLARFVAAGRGLAASHAVGLVHRDFKPDNVLVARDERVIVTDFGLVSFEDSEAQPGLASIRSEAGTHGMETLTRTGAVMGTPAYMAPEQHQGGTIDGRTDQFSFCVALWEGLYGARPFAGDSYPELAINVCEGAIEPPPEHAKHRAVGRIPGRLEAVLRRGLHSDAAERWPSMDALLAELQRRPAERWTAVAIAAAVIGSLGGLAWLARSPDAPEPCPDPTPRLAEVWDDERRTALQASFEAIDRPHARASGGKVSERLDEWARAWVHAQTQICRATHVSREQSEALLDHRMTCLERERLRVATAVQLLIEDLDPAAMDKSVAAMGALPAPAECGVSEPDGAAQAVIERGGRAAELERTLLEHDVGLRLGRYAAVAEALGRAMDEVRQTEDVALLIEALTLAGRAEHAAGNFDRAAVWLLEAVELASKHGAARAEALAWPWLVTVVAGQGRTERGLGLLVGAKAAVERVDEPVARARLAAAEGELRKAEGDLEAARAAFERALEVAERAFGGRNAELGAYYNNLGVALSDLGRAEQAEAYYRRTLELWERELGPDHPSVGGALSNLGIQLQHAGRYDEAEALYARALRIWRGALGERHHLVAVAEENLGVVAQLRGRTTDARVHYEQALKIRTAVFGESHPMVASSHNNLGNIAWMERRLDDAMRHFDAAERMWSASLGPQHPQILDLYVNRGAMATELGRYDEARTWLEKAVEAGEATLGSQHPTVARSTSGLANVWRLQGRCDRAGPLYRRAIEGLRAGQAMGDVDAAYALGGLGACELEDGRATEAAELLAQAVAIRERAGVEPLILARDRFNHARALWRLGQRDEARAAARRAEGEYAALGAQAAAYRETVERWLARPQ